MTENVTYLEIVLIYLAGINYMYISLQPCGTIDHKQKAIQ